MISTIAVTLKPVLELVELLSVFSLLIISLGGGLTTEYVLEYVAIDLASNRQLRHYW